MSVTSYLRALPPIDRSTQRLQARPSAKTNVPEAPAFEPSSLRDAVVEDGKGAVEAGHAVAAGVSQSQGDSIQALRINSLTSANPTTSTAGARGNQSPRGAALYALVGQMAGHDPSISELLRSWNSIMQNGHDMGSSGGLHVTA